MFRIISLLLFGCRRSVLIHFGKNTCFTRIFTCFLHVVWRADTDLRDDVYAPQALKSRASAVLVTWLTAICIIHRRDTCSSRAFCGTPCGPAAYMHTRAQLIQVAFCNFGGAAINVYVLYRRHLVVFARLPPPSEVWVACFSTTMNFAFWVGFLTNTTIAQEQLCFQIMQSCI